MSQKTEGAGPAKDKAAPQGGGATRLLGLVLPAVIAGAASFGGAKFAVARRAPSAGAQAAHVEPPKPPGPTLRLDPFLFTVPDASKKVHPTKVSLAIEFDQGSKEDELKALTERIRDSALAYLRTLTYEQALDPSVTDKLRTELLVRVRSAGALGAQRVLVTDYVVQ